MAQINDAKKATLTNLGYTGPIDEAYHNYLAAETGSDLDATQDLEKLLFTTLGYTGSLYDMWFEFLRDNGFTNSLQDMLYAFWNSDDAGLSPLHFSEFYSPLEYTAVPERAAVGTTATFTRATTATFTDFEGVLRTAPAGCARFVGARFVRNLLTYTEDFSNAVWVNASGNTITTNAVASPIDGAITADKITPPASAAFHSIYTSYALSGASTAYSIYVKNGGYNYAYISPDNGTSGVTINLTTGATSTTGSVTAYAIDAGNGWWRVACISTATTSNLRIYLGSTTAPQSFTGDGTSGIYVFGAQLENITGRTDQTTPSEYVSVGVPGDWAGDELVTNGTFATDTTGWTAGNGALLAAVSGELRVTNVGATNGYAYAAVSTVVGQKYVLSLRAKCGTAPQVNYNLGTTIAGAEYGSAASTSTTGELLTLQFTATATTAYIALVNSLGADLTGFWDNISVKPAYYHGSFVDGVKCFATDIAGNAIPSTTMLGYSAEGARTNLCLQSQTFDNAAWSANNVSLITSADQYVAPDGTTTMDKLTCGAGNSTHYTFIGGVAYTAAAHTASFYLRYVNHRWVSVRVNDTASNFHGSFDLLNGVAGAVSAGVTSKIEATGLANVYRVSITCTTILATNNLLIALNNSDNAGTDTWNAAGTEAIGAWGAQVELGSFASSYIATTTVAVTRDADVLTYSSSGNVSDTAGWAYAEVAINSALASVGSDILAANTGGNAALLSDGGPNLRIYDGTAYRQFGVAIPHGTTPAKISASYGGSSSNGAVNGTIGSASSFDGNMNSGANIYVGIRSTGANEIAGTIRNVRIGQRQLSSSELQAVTS